MNRLRRFLTLSIGLVWLLNGIWAKLLQGVPRHPAIVARFFGSASAPALTSLIGIGEAIIGIWWLSGFQRKTNALLQIGCIICMNTLEALFAEDLLLWGRWNALWGALLCVAIAFTAFARRTKPTAHAVLS
ncbi:MAG: hypothetical protein EOO08_01765 [Chitinophagaceae bacterium]|nr:MAG: hypothetical protein EOO08_01765 [Chitinophagaceae bacterium]